jgi:acetolactate synthase-1/2/3 large subunit
VRVNLSEWIFSVLPTDTVYYLPGGQAMYLVDALGRSDKKAVCCLHEQQAGYMALAHSQITGFGVCLTTSGPGATNALTPCAAAWADSVNVLFISGQCTSDSLAVPPMRTRGIQEVDIISMVNGITVDCRRPDTTVEARFFVDWILSYIDNHNVRPGPYWLDLPLDLQQAEV